MNSMLLHLLDQSICIRLTQTLLHFLWQGLAIGLCTVLVAWMSRTASSRVRYGIHATSLVLMALCVPTTFLLTNVIDSGLNDQEAVAFHELESLSVPSGMVQPALPQTGKSMPESSTDQSPLLISDAAGPAQSSTFVSVSEAENNVLTRTRTRFESAIRPYALHAACAYFLGVIAMLGRLCFALWGGHRLRRTATPIADRKLLQRIQLQARRIGLKAAPAVAYCDRIAVPVVAGILRPMILLPLWIATDMHPEQVLSILAHEMAHIRRFDSFVNLLQRMLETILFFHPAVWYISRQLSFERENCCDDAVVNAGCESVQCASELLRMAELCAAKHGSISASSLATLAASGDSGSQLKRRIVRLIIGEQRLSLTRVDSLTLVLTATLIVGAMAGFWRHAVAASSDKSDLTAALEPSSSDTTNAANRGEVEFSGKVVDMDGKPVIGAEIWFASAPYETLFTDAPKPIRQVACSNDQGEFSFQIEPLVTAYKTLNWTYFSYLIAKAPGYGCDGLLLAAFEKNPASSIHRDSVQQRIDRGTVTGRFASHTLKLPPAVGPVNGRLVDLEGRPVAGVVVSVENLRNLDMTLLQEAFEKNSRELKVESLTGRYGPAGGELCREDWQVLIPPVTTNENGEFTLPGLGRDQMATVTLLGERVAADRFFIVGTEMPTASLPHLSDDPSESQDVYTGLDFTYAVNPGIPLNGVVTEFQSGKPIAKAKVYVYSLFGSGGTQGSPRRRRDTQHIRVETDEQGRFQLLGIPPGNQHLLKVDPPKSEPWLIASHEVSIDPIQRSATTNIQVFRGIWIEGRLTDETTGESIFGDMDYLALQKNPNTPKHFGLRDSHQYNRFQTDQSGRYRVVGLPGPGVLYALSGGATDYARSVGADKVDGFNPKLEHLPTTPTIMPFSNWNRIQQIDPPVDAQSYSIDLTLSAGSSLVGHVLEPKPISDRGSPILIIPP